MRIYLDNAATTPISPEVVDVMTEMMREQYGNPSSIHADGRTVRAALERARKTVANCIGASIGEIFFTSGGTESNNMALKCSVRDLGVKRIITSPTEHHCVLHTVERLEKTDGIQVEYVQVAPCGTIDYEHLEALLQSSSAKTLVSLMHANNEIGVLSDMQKISTLCETYNALYHSDTVQTVGHFPMDVNETKINFLSGAAHKFHGPKGVGFIYINSDSMLAPFIDGGAQERNMRGGTENVYGIIGLAKALEMATEEMDERIAHISGIRSYLAEQLKTHFDDLHFNTDLSKPSLYTVLSVAFPPSPKSDLLLLSLDIEGISASGGSACSSGAEKGSHVISAINGSSNHKTIRFSFSHYNTKEEIDIVIEKLKTIIPSAEGVAV
ncbi:MAG: cysteine desulfurase family protein [Bacteroidota bacterium]